MESKERIEKVETKHEKPKKVEKWYENVETCSGCGVHWKKIGESCRVCYAPPEKQKEIKGES